jgi:hypothetical protein
VYSCSAKSVPIFLKIVKYVLSIPVRSAAVERVF